MFLGGVGGGLCVHITDKGWGWYSGQNETPSVQNETHLGNLYENKSALELGEKFNLGTASQ